MKCNNSLTAINFSKILCLFILTGGLFLTGCSNDSKTKSKTSKEKTTDEEDADKSSDINYTDVANDVCDCISDLENSLSSKSKKIFIKASKTDDPQTTMKEELLNISDVEEQQKIGKEFESFESTDMVNCMNKVQKKYPEIKKPNKKEQKKLLAAIEDNCSEFAAALMNMGAKANSDKE
jgi:hypothetical protein